MIESADSPRSYHVKRFINRLIIGGIFSPVIIRDSADYIIASFLEPVYKYKSVFCIGVAVEFRTLKSPEAYNRLAVNLCIVRRRNKLFFNVKHKVKLQTANTCKSVSTYTRNIITHIEKSVIFFRRFHHVVKLCSSGSFYLACAGIETRYRKSVNTVLLHPSNLCIYCFFACSVI